MRIQSSLFVCFQLFLVGTLCQEISSTRNRTSELIQEFNSRPMTIVDALQNDLIWGRSNGLYYTDYTVGRVDPVENSVKAKHVQYSIGYNCCNADCTHSEEQSHTETYERSSTWEVGTEIGTGEKSPIQFKVSGSYSRAVTKGTAETTTRRFELSSTSPDRSFWTDGNGERKPAGGQRFVEYNTYCYGDVETKDTWYKGYADYCGFRDWRTRVATFGKVYFLENTVDHTAETNSVPLRAANGEVFKLFGWDKYECGKKMDDFEPQTY